MSRRKVYFWREVWPLLAGLSRRTGVNVNRLVNVAVRAFVGASSEERLRLEARLSELMREERRLRRVSRVMLRSGSYLPRYAERLLRPVESEVWSGQVPVPVLSLREEAIARRILAERERIAGEMVEVLDRLLPAKKFRLSPVRRGARSISVEDGRKEWGDR